MLEKGETEGRSVREGERQRGGVLEKKRDKGEECWRRRETEGRSVREGERLKGGVLERERDRGKEC